MENNCQNPVTDNVGAGADSQKQVFKVVNILVYYGKVTHDNNNDDFYQNEYVKEIKGLTKESILQAFPIYIKENRNVDKERIIFDLMTTGFSYIDNTGYEYKEDSELNFQRHDESHFCITKGILFNGKLFVEESLLTLIPC